MAARHRQHGKRKAEAERLARVDCGECGKPAGLVTGEVVYPHRPDLHARPFWRCCACGAYVGCHDGTYRPLGTPCGPETRLARSKAHETFDPLWRAKVTAGAPKGAAREAGVPLARGATRHRPEGDPHRPDGRRDRTTCRRGLRAIRRRAAPVSTFQRDTPLPGEAPDVCRWTPARKEELLRRVGAGEITEAAALERYGFTPEELKAWRGRFSRHGRRGLCNTKLQAVR